MKLNFGAAINTVYGFRGYVALYVTVCQLAAAGGAAETEGAAFAKTVQGLQHQKHKQPQDAKKSPVLPAKSWQSQFPEEVVAASSMRLLFFLGGGARAEAGPQLDRIMRTTGLTSGEA